MYVENYFKDGNFVTLIPVGLPITLQYNISGNLEKVYVGFDSSRKDASDSLMMKLLNRKYVPGKISITKGTSWVYGILYTNDLPTDVSGVIPSCLEVALETKFINHPEQFRFFAGNIECTSVPFTSAGQVNNYLHLVKFNVLPGWVVPPMMDKSVFDKWLNSNQYTFKQIVMGYFMYTKEKMHIYDTGVAQYQVVDSQSYVDDNGYFRIKLTFDNNTDQYLPYSVAMRYGTAKGSVVYVDAKRNIFDSIVYKEEYEDHIRCPFCGKLYSANVIFGEESICSDIHCVSRMIRPIQRFISVLGLPEMHVDTIRENIINGSLICLTDIFDLEPYSSLRIKATIGRCLQSLIPLSLIQKSDIYSLLSTACGNDITTMIYYINHPSDIVSDLRINHPDAQKLIMWLSDDCNARDITTVLELDQIEIQQVEKRFDGAPIFRNKLIYITGEFIHGNIPEIASILQSYSARVTTTFNNTVDCVLVGGTNEGVSGKDIVAARNIGIPIISEPEFFAQYDIDADLASIF